MMRARFPIGLLLSLGFLAQPAHALIDSGDSDGMSDIWEGEHSFSTTDDGTLIPAQAPTADADGDGVSNIEECKAGTDPRSGVPALGLFQAAIGPDPADPAKRAVLWHGVPGKLYRVFMSPDMGANWIQLGEPRIGTGGTIAHGVSNDTPAEAYRFFYRVQAYDVDSDADGLNDHEEFLFGTDPELWDQNGNGLKDGWEVLYFGALGADPELDSDGDGMNNLKEHELGTNPVATDTDSDGIDDGAEEEFGLDPRNPDSDSDGTPDGQESIEPRWTGILREIDDYDGGGYDANNDGIIGYGEGSGVARMYGRWPDGPYKKHVGDPISYPDLNPVLGDEEDGIPWPAPLPEVREEEDIFSAGGIANTTTVPSPPLPLPPPPAASSPPTTFFASLQHRRNVVRIARPAEHDLEFRSLIRKRKTVDSVEFPDEFEERVVTIRQGERESTPLDLVPTFSGGGMATADYTEAVSNDQIRLIAEEVSFSGNHFHQLKSDVGGMDYSPPHWKDTNQDSRAKTHLIDGKPQPEAILGERNYPTAFTRSTPGHPSIAKVKGRFKITNLKPNEKVTISAKGVGLTLDDLGIKLPEIELTPEPDGTVTYPETESQSSLADTIQFYNAAGLTPFVIEWKVKVGDSLIPHTLAVTKHTVFLTLADPPPGLPSGKGFRETTFWLACANAKGESDMDIQDLVENKIYKGSHSFKSRAILRFSHNFGSPIGLPLQYWGDDYDHGYPVETGAGVCRHWSDFMIDVLAVHNIPAFVYGVKPKGAASANPHSVTPDAFPGIASDFILKLVIIRPEGENVELDPDTNEPPMFNTIVPAQGRFDTDVAWGGHVIVKVPIGQLEILYDPSYGTGPFNGGLLEYNNSMSGFYDSNTNRLWRPDGFLELKNYMPPP